MAIGYHGRENISKFIRFTVLNCPRRCEGFELLTELEKSKNKSTLLRSLPAIFWTESFVSI